MNLGVYLFYLSIKNTEFKIVPKGGDYLTHDVNHRKTIITIS
ncbi:MAG: hypothetical protein ACJAUH_001570 [Saprospiraceae bacterium]|jgi:hypothetical protein